MKIDINDLIKTALENNHIEFSVEGWPATILGIGLAICGAGAIVCLKAIDARTAEASDDFRQNSWHKAA